MIAAVAYTGWNPVSGIEMTSPSHSRTLSTTAEPRDWVAMANVACDGSAPSVVSSRYWSTPPAAAPPGTTWLTASDDNTMRNMRHRLGRTSGGRSDRASCA